MTINEMYLLNRYLKPLQDEVERLTKENEASVLENEVTLMGKAFNVYGTVEEPLFKAKDVADWIGYCK